MAELKTKPTRSSVSAFLRAVGDDRMRQDCLTVLDIMKKATGTKPRMWGSTIVGFGSYHYKYDSGREGDWFLTGFSPRKQALTLYIMGGFPRHHELMRKLGKHKTGSSCLYVRKLADLDLRVLKQLILQSVRHLKESY